jgi:hypothetical protein
MLIELEEKNVSGIELASSLGNGVVTPWSLEKSKTFDYHDKSLLENHLNLEGIVEGARVYKI